jgi:hypothetical protein
MIFYFIFFPTRGKVWEHSPVTYSCLCFVETPNTVKLIESRRVRWKGYASCNAEMTINTNFNLKIPHEDLNHACENVLKRISLEQCVRMLTGLIWLVIECSGCLL